MSVNFCCPRPRAALNDRPRTHALLKLAPFAPSHFKHTPSSSVFKVMPCCPEPPCLPHAMSHYLPSILGLPGATLTKNHFFLGLAF